MMQQYFKSFFSIPGLRNPLTLTIFLMVFCALALSYSDHAEAKSQTSSNPVDSTNLYAYHTTLTNPFWSIMLRNMEVSVTYNAVLTDAQSGNAINDGASFLVGTQIRCEAPYSGADISWFGLGYGYDSPNGHWVNNAAPPAGTYCQPGDRLLNYYAIRFFVPFNVHRPQHTCSFSGTAAVTQLDSDTWQVTSPGTLVATVNYPATYGVFYMGTEKDTIVNQDADDEYRIVSNTCVESPYALSVPNGQVWVNDPSDPDGGYYTATYGTYQTAIPARSISFNLTANSPNSAPSNPVISGPTNGLVNTSYDFSVVASDVNGDQLHYGLSDATCTAVYEWLPASGLVAQNISQTLSKMWAGTGAQTLYIFAEDSNGVRSSCGTHTITVSPAPLPTASLTVNGSAGPIDVPKNTTVTLVWTSANAPSCTKWGGTWGGGQDAGGVTGSQTTVVTQTTTYMISCGGVQSTVTVNVVNQTPNAPSISYVSGTRQINQPLTFSVQGTDPDSDDIFYEVDWMDGTPLATTQVVANNTAQPATHSWSTAGVVTFQARTVDSAGARSGWTQHQETLVALPPTATIQVSVNGGALTTSDQTINPGDQIDIDWRSQDASTCSGSGAGFNTGGSPNGTDRATTPAPNSSTDFVASCTGPGGGITDTIRVTTRQLPNISRPNITHQLSSSFNPTTGTYDYVDVSLNTSNTGGSDTQAIASYELKFDRGRDGFEYTTSGSLGLIAVGQPVTRTERVSGGIPFGNTTIEVTVDSTNAVAETDESDNTFAYDLVITPPDPGLSISVNRGQVRNGESVTLTWNTPVTYSLDCRVSGPSLDVNPSGLSGVRVTPTINAKSVYTYSCTEPITNTTFTDTIPVETQGNIEET